MLLESQAIQECFKIIKRTEEHLDRTAHHFQTTNRSLGEAVQKLQSMSVAKVVRR